MVQPLGPVVATGEDLGRGGEVLDEPIGRDSADEGEEPFEYKDPPPAVVSPKPGHVADPKGEDPT